jgi:hypothetical protein
LPVASETAPGLWHLVDVVPLKGPSMKAKKTKLILSLFLALLPLRQEQARGADPESTVKNLYVFSATHF